MGLILENSYLISCVDYLRCLIFIFLHNWMISPALSALFADIDISISVVIDS